jgi:hypothetical protein
MFERLTYWVVITLDAFAALGIFVILMAAIFSAWYFLQQFLYR